MDDVEPSYTFKFRGGGYSMPESQGLDLPIGIIHRAGPLLDSVQRCLDCGGVLCNYQHAMVMEGESFPGGYAEGQDVTFWGPLDGSNSSAAGVHNPAIRCVAKTQ